MPILIFRQRLIDGTEVIQETYSKVRHNPTEDFPRHDPEGPALGHHDIITDINMCFSNQHLIVSASRDGVVKIWK